MTKHNLETYRTRLYRTFIEPVSQQVDTRRREFILNVLLVGLAAVSILALCSSLIIVAIHENSSGASSLITTGVFLIFLILGHRAVKRNHSTVVSYLLLAGLGLLSIQLLLQWSFLLPEVILAFTLTIVIASVLLTARAGLLVAGAFTAIILVVSYLQANHYLRPDLSWRNRPLGEIDAVGYALVFSIIGLVSWLSNREIDRSLARARQSETELLQERDNLEIKVVERTKQLQRSQMARTMELQRFATFGKVSAGLVHELANPLMAATLNLDQLKSNDSELLLRVRQNLQNLERYLLAARKQLQSSSTVVTFSLDSELEHVVSFVQPVAQQSSVKLDLPATTHIRLYGDPIKFSQLVSNLLMNAAESYGKGTDMQRRVVTLRVERVGKGAQITVHDQGSGISKARLQRIFDPFYSGKTTSLHSGLGIGLSLVKQFVEEDFQGRLEVTSSKKQGTTFIATVRGAKRR